MSSNRSLVRKWLEYPCWFAGTVLVGCYVYSQFNAAAFQQRQQHLFETVETTPAAVVEETGTAPRRGDTIGRLEIPRLGLSVMVVSGDDDEMLKVAAGHLPDTPLPWQRGNTAIAGHRDPFFRPLRLIRVNDDVRIVTAHGTFDYRVRDLSVVEPTDVEVLDASTSAAPQSLTLLTCYPFTFVGHAPKRYVVHADLVGSRDDTEPFLAAGLVPQRPPGIAAPSLARTVPPSGARPAHTRRLAKSSPGASRRAKSSPAKSRPANVSAVKASPVTSTQTKAATFRRLPSPPPAPRLLSANR
jgi:sortase A